MSEELKPFKVPKMARMVRCKVKHPRVTGARIEDGTLILSLSCGHEVIHCRIPSWTSCYRCPVQTIHFEKPYGYREIPFTTTRSQ